MLHHCIFSRHLNRRSAHNCASCPKRTWSSKRLLYVNLQDGAENYDVERRASLSRSMSTKRAECGIFSYRLAFCVCLRSCLSTGLRTYPMLDFELGRMLNDLGQLHLGVCGSCSARSITCQDATFPAHTVRYARGLSTQRVTSASLIISVSRPKPPYIVLASAGLTVYCTSCLYPAY